MLSKDFEWILSHCWSNPSALYFEHGFNGKNSYSLKELFGNQINDWGKLLVFVYRAHSVVSLFKALIVKYEHLDYIAQKTGYRNYMEFQDRMIKKGYYPI